MDQILAKKRCVPSCHCASGHKHPVCAKSDYCLTQVFLQSSAAGQCGATALCDISVPIADISLEFDSSSLAAGEESGLEISMLVTVPITKSQTIDIGLPGFTAPDFADAEFDSTTLVADPLFSSNERPVIPALKPLGCIQDTLSKR